MAEHYDPDVMFPPSKYVKIKNVPIFDEHTSSGAGGKPKEITVEYLNELAKYGNEKFDKLGLATPLVLGHSKDDADEKDQPELIGWCLKYRVDKLAKTDRKALYTDWYVKKKYENAIEEFPFRSIELYYNRRDIQPVSLLKSAPERDLPIIRYERDEDNVYRYNYSHNPVSPSELKNMDNDETKMVADAVANEGSSAKQDNTELAQLSQQVNKLTSLMTDLMTMLQSEQQPQPGEEEGGEDLLANMKDKSPDAESDEDEDAENPDADAEGSDDKEEAPEEDAADEDKEPEQYAANAGPDNTFIPGMEKKTKMSRTNDDVTKYERKVAELEKNYEELAVKYNRTQAEKAVTSLETDHNIDFGSAEDRDEEVSIFTKLLTVNKTGDSFKKHFDKVAKKYKRKEASVPDSSGAGNALRYSRVPEETKPAIASGEDVQAFLKARADDASLTPAGWAAKRNGVK